VVPFLEKLIIVLLANHVNHHGCGIVRVHAPGEYTGLRKGEFILSLLFRRNIPMFGCGERRQGGASRGGKQRTEEDPDRHAVRIT
jgi:hypothetical protein